MEKSQLGQLLAKGGEGEIFTTTDPGLVAKIYHQGKMTPAVEQKLRAMLANPPHDSMRAQGRVSIAWVVDLVTVNGIVQGYVMPRLEKAQAERLNDPALNPSTCRDLIDFYNPSTRRKNFPWFHYLYLLRTARNIAAAVDSFHAKGYVIGDVNESNILVALDTIVTFVDTDSFQVPDCGKVHRCQVGKPEYTPPELQGVSFKDIDRTQAHDLFGLGVIIFQLLMQGQHPFAGVYRGQGDAPEIKDRIEAGHFPHGTKNASYMPVPLAPPFDILPSRLQRLFIQCFDNGYHNPDHRPTAKQWRDALVEAELEMNRCAINEHHFYANHLSRCPWCELSQKFGGRDPFPSQAEIQQSWGLKMSPSSVTPIITSSTQRLGLVQPTPFISFQPATTRLTPISVPPSSANITAQPNFSGDASSFFIRAAFCAFVPMILGFGITSIYRTHTSAEVKNESMRHFNSHFTSYYLSGRSGSIKEFYRSATYNNNPVAYYALGIVRYESGDKQGAISDYDSAISLDPNYTNAYTNRGGVKRDLGDEQGAMSDYDRAISLDPNNSITYYNRGNIKHDLGDDRGAISDYDRAIFINPSYVDAYINRGILKDEKLNDLSGALSDYERAIYLQPNSAKAFYNRGILEVYKLNNRDRGIQDLRRAARLCQEQGQNQDAQYVVDHLQKLGAAE